MCRAETAKGPGMFWTAAAAMAGAVTLILVLALRRGGAAAPSAPDSTVYRAQLAEIERDVARGTVSPEEGQRLRAEVARRLLEADRQAKAGAGPGTRGPVVAGAAVAAVLLLAGGALTYLELGAPGYPDLPHSLRLAEARNLHAARPTQAEAEARAPAPVRPEADPAYLALMEQLRARLAEVPDDPQGLALLAEHEARLGNLAAARAAQERLIAVKGPQATAADHVFLAQIMLQAAGGSISVEAEAALERALALDPNQPDALFVMGLARMQVGRPDLGFRHWQRYLQVAPADSPWQAEVRRGIAQLAAVAGVPQYQPPPLPAAPPLAGPSAAEIEAAREMDPEAQAEMVRGMVEGLAERLATQGGTAEEWARLIGALGVLGETERARAIWGEAQGRFAGRAADLATIRAAAVQAGVAE